MFTPEEQQLSNHRAEVYKIARDYIVETFHLVSIMESHFNPVRFNSNGVWGDFRSRIKELGDNRFEVMGWIQPLGSDEEQLIWSVVVRYELEDPEGWRYRRIDEEYRNEPEITSWRFGDYRSVPYEADFSKDYFALYDRSGK